MPQALAILTFDTPGRGLTEITEDIARWLRESDIRVVVLTLFCQHTSASLLVTENASSAVHRDLIRWLGAAAPDGAGYEHAGEGPDDMPAHIRSVLTGTSLSIPVADGRMKLGTWQGVFIAEHRTRAHKRTIAAHIHGD